MAELPRPFARQGFFFVDSVAPFQKRIFDKVRLPEEIEPLRPFHEQGNNVAFRFPLKNTVILKGRVPKDSKPVGPSPPLIDQPLSVPPEGKTLVVRGNKPQPSAVPPGKAP